MQTKYTDKIEFTVEQMRQADIQTHVNLKRMYGLEHLDFYEDERGRYCCRYISDPEDFNYDVAMDNADLMFILSAFSVQQGKIFFKDYQQYCTGLDGLNELYLPMKLAGL